MKKTAAFCALALGLVACGDGNPFTDDGSDEGTPDERVGSVFFDDEQNSALVANNIVFDESTDTLIINNIPFDDPNNEYVRITTEAFVNSGFDAYESAPAPGSGEDQYFAIFRRSDSGRTQVAGVTSAEFIGFGFGGAGAQRLGDAPDLPLSGILTYNGEYGGVRTVLNGVGNGDRVEYVTGDALLTADFGDFDEVGAVNGRVTNRVLYDDTGTQIGTLNSIITMANGDIDFENGLIVSSTAVLLGGDGAIDANGNWEGVFAGPDGKEIAGIVVVEGVDENTVPTSSTFGTEESIREIGGIVAVTP